MAITVRNGVTEAKVTANDLVPMHEVRIWTELPFVIIMAINTPNSTFMCSILVLGVVTYFD
jgi:hypothetical protein